MLEIIRDEIFENLNTEEPLTYGEMRSRTRFTSMFDGDRFALRLRIFLLDSLVGFDPSKRRYHISDLGRVGLGAGV